MARANGVPKGYHHPAAQLKMFPQIPTESPEKTRHPNLSPSKIESIIRIITMIKRAMLQEGAPAEDLYRLIQNYVHPSTYLSMLLNAGSDIDKEVMFSELIWHPQQRGMPGDLLIWT